MTAVYVTAVPVTTVDVAEVFFYWHLGDCCWLWTCLTSGACGHSAVHVTSVVDLLPHEGDLIATVRGPVATQSDLVATQGAWACL